MNPERWRLVERLFHAARAMNADRRSQFLKAACDDEDLRREVIDLLAWQDTAPSFIENPALGVPLRKLLRVGENSEVRFRLSAGMRLGPYEILEPLGAGGMGEIYSARDTRLGRAVALNILSASGTDHAAIRSQFEVEARAISQLNHPHICTLYDIGNDGGTQYMVMEYLEGQTLAARLQQGPIPDREVLQIGIEIALALE